jgi:hypothetical protein
VRRLDFLDGWVLAATCFVIALLTFVHLEHTFGFVASGLLGAVLLVVGALAFILLAVAVFRKSKALLVFGTYSILAIVLSSVLGSLIIRTQERFSFRRGDSVAAALASYHDEAGRYPESLSELVPAQLERLA